MLQEIIQQIQQCDLVNANIVGARSTNLLESNDNNILKFQAIALSENTYFFGRRPTLKEVEFQTVTNEPAG